MTYEDFNAYTEVDPNNELDVWGTGYTTLDQNFDAGSRLYKDFGVDHFDGDFTHNFRLYAASESTLPYVGIWALSNSPSGYNSFDDGDIYISTTPSNGTFALVLFCVNGSGATSIGLTYNKEYAIVVWREGTVYYVAITDIGLGEIVDTITIDAGTVKAFRYLYAQFELYL